MTRQRLAQLRKTLVEKGLDALLVSSLYNIRYLSGFSGSNGLIVVRRNSAHFLTDSRYVLQSREEVKGFKRIIAQRGLFDEVAKQKLLSGCARVGFESQHLPHSQYIEMRRQFPRIRLVPTAELVEDMVLVKDQSELESIKEAVRISDMVFDTILDTIRPGVRELDVAAEISYLHKTHGAEQDAFECIVASGERGALPHARATSKKIKSGDLVTLDFGCTVRGYNSDITRTVGVGRVSKKQRRMYDVVLEAQRAAIAEAHAGMPASELDAVARDRIAAAGYGKYFTHSLGHGLGLQVHERPRVSSLGKERLQSGSVITIEPGVYIPGVGGVRIEDDVVLTPTGCQVLNSAPKELMVV
ncbi:MAG: M24 family metallopeptidase [Bacteroidota bacterium]